MGENPRIGGSSVFSWVEYRTTIGFAKDLRRNQVGAIFIKSLERLGDHVADMAPFGAMSATCASLTPHNSHGVSFLSLLWEWF